MQPVEGILFEPVGCLAEFPAEPFDEIAVRVFGRKNKPSRSGSWAYWHWLTLVERSGTPLSDSQKRSVEALEIDAVSQACLYEDVLPALGELRSMGVHLSIASSLSTAAVDRFLEAGRARGFFSAIWTRDNSGGIKTAPLGCAIHAASLCPERVMFLADTAEGFKVAKRVGVNTILMMNDPDEARRLALEEPAGGIVSLYELPDFLRLVTAQNAGRRGTAGPQLD
ncbi:MAG: HAD family hydrolase [Acidobacteriota bacterium]|jgi:phosphoglycolate phosphatase-like HAD superfamily hydrolase|nr:HAD family hydrolase [Acidobacteriota bacterium]